MKLFSIAIYRTDKQAAELLVDHFDLSTFGFFQRGSVQEFMQFFAKTVSERTALDQRQSVEQQDYVGHVYRRSEGVSGVVIADKEYPARPAFALLNKCLDDFLAKNPKERWGKGCTFPELQECLVKYQDPKQADTIMRVQRELDETKIVLHHTIDAMLKRGEKLEDLIDRSEDLSIQSRAFYKTAKKTNSCCVLM